MVAPDRRPLAGTVQVDETTVRASEEGVFGRDPGSKKHLVIGAVEEREAACGRARLAPVGCASKEALQLWISDTVAEGAHVRTDGLASYDGLDHAYEHDVQIIGNPKTASEKFPHVHRVFSLFKRLILSTYQGSVIPKYLAAYCNEWVFRFNRRTSKSRTLLLQRVRENGVRSQARVHVFVRRNDITDLLVA